MSNSFSIQEISKQGELYRYLFIGSIDAHAASTLESLSSLPSGAQVLLDFGQVERVNSMGLSLLLKLFEQWEHKKIRVEVQKLNRMINMLFKITGLGRFISSAKRDIAIISDAHTVNPEPPRHPEHKPATPHIPHDKLNFVATLQSGQQLTGWYLLNTYLQRKLNRAIHFEQSANVPDGNMTDLFFAKPFEACEMIKNHGFIPILKPISEADEVVILTRIDDTRSLKDLEGLTVSVASEGSFVYLLGRFLCDENGVNSAKFIFDIAGNEIKALQSLIRGKCDLTFMLKKTFQGLSSFSRSNVQKLDESETDFASHLFCISPQLQDHVDELLTVLTAMTEDNQGQQILTDIQIEGWHKPEAGELQMLQAVYSRYT
ncbi:PhnD/SsuA/transferrin family substrate-binding protein [Crenothrix sp.]|uniref:PhnD/SsuA/transferrin family substrate-binding protein n=1 Tax=Crenothrix sp. TaxID=3100433 RepID=UPI00374CFB33